MMNRIGVLLLFINLSAIAFVGCRKEAPEPPSKPKYEFKGDEGEIKGVMKFDGRPPARVKIDLSQDPNCANSLGSKWVDDWLVEDGKLQTVFVYPSEIQNSSHKKAQKRFACIRLEVVRPTFQQAIYFLCFLCLFVAILNRALRNKTSTQIASHAGRPQA